MSIHLRVLFFFSDNEMSIEVSDMIENYVHASRCKQDEVAESGSLHEIIV